jgi:ATP-dependent RNA helicase DDX52/ROK1
VNEFRNKNRIKVEGDNIPDPIESFDDLEKNYNIKQYLLRNIKNSGYDSPTPIQMQAMTAMLHVSTMMILKFNSITMRLYCIFMFLL